MVPVDDGRSSPAVLDLFAAPGGMSCGFRQAGFQILSAVDSDHWGCETLRWNFSNGTEVIEDDIRRLVFNGRVDVVIGGPPCQSFSQVGRPKINHLTQSGRRTRFIDDERNRLYKEFVRAVESLRPQFFVMENVPGIASYENGRIAQDVQADFGRTGYSVSMNVLKAADYGVPQIRRRAIFIGNRIGIQNPFPAATFAADARQTNLSSELRPHRTIRDAIADLPSLEAGGGIHEVEYSTPPQSEYQEWVRDGATKLLNHVARKHSGRDIEIFKTLEPGQQMTDLPEYLIKEIPYPQNIFKDKIKKQRWDRPSYAIVAHMQKDGLMYIHPDQPRSFTPREAARIQSFPDRWRFAGPLTQQFKQIGNAVPPLLAQSIAEAIKPFIVPVSNPHVDNNVSETPFSAPLA